MLAETNETKKTWQSEFYNWCERRGCDEKTLRNYSSDLRYFADWFEQQNGCPFEPGLINRSDLKAFRAWCLDERRLAPGTWNRRHSSLVQFCRWSLQNGHIPAGYDPMEGIKRAEIVRVCRWLGKRDYGQFVRQLDISILAANTEKRRYLAIRDAAISVVMLWGTLRVDEACTLEMGDVEMGQRKRVIHVRHGKRDKWRDVPVNPEMYMYLKRWIDVRGDNAGLLFCGVKPRQVENRIRDLGDAVGIDLTPHKLRHTAIKRVTDRSGIAVAKTMAGHANVNTTTIYAQPGWEDLVQAANAMA